MHWSKIHSRLLSAGLLTNPERIAPDVRIRGVCQDSRKSHPQYVFVAITGHADNGNAYIHHALKFGAVVVVSEEDIQGLPHVVQVTNARKASAVIAATFHGIPGDSLHLTGVTGTDGKTTTASLIQYVLQSTGTPTGLIGTVTNTTGQSEYISELTTPDPTELHPLLAEMVQSDCKACVIEVSSHALDQYRTDTLNFSIGVFTNLSQDHLDYHKSEDQYLKAKKRLFDNLSDEAIAVYNKDEPEASQIISDTQASLCSYGLYEDADIHFRLLDHHSGSLQLNLDGHIRKFRLSGWFNAYNIAAAYGAVCMTGLSSVEVIDALSEAPPVPGRFDQYQCDDGTLIVIDYAHTPSALREVLRTLSSFCPTRGSLWCIFGCGGDRDPMKRPIMGAIAEKFAHRVVITSDNPRSENPWQIIDDIASGARSTERVDKITSRPEAVRFVAHTSNPGDVILVAGKGHESTQIRDESQTEMSDRELVLTSFSSRNPVPLL